MAFLEGRPLSGTKVLDLSRLLPGPFASLLLGDLGAQVDKVEDLSGGDYLRLMPPVVEPTDPKSGIPAQSALFLAINRNKRSACLDLKNPLARETFRELVKSYDVLLEQFRPGVMDRLGLSHEQLRKDNPRLVICALTGYGQDGPLAKRAGHDINYIGRAGLLGFTGPVSGPPAVPGYQLADIGGALWSVLGILSALLQRDKSGQGTIVDISMVESAMGFAAASFGTLFGGHVPKRGDEPLTGAIAPYGTYVTKDGRAVSLGSLEPKFWMAFSLGVGLEVDMNGLMPGPHQAALKARVAEIFASRTLAEWIAFGEANDCCLEPVLSPDELENDPQHQARKVFFEMPSPWGPLRQMRLPLTPADVPHSPPPSPGEHTDVILREAGISDERIRRLRSEGAAR